MGLKVKVLLTGDIIIDEKTADLEELRERLIELKNKGGTVWYYREEAQGSLPQQAVEVMRLIIMYQLPVSLSSKPDFSDYINEEGKSILRRSPP